MGFWNFIGELFLFRWLWGSRIRGEGKSSDADTTVHSLRDDNNDSSDLFPSGGSNYENDRFDVDNRDCDYSISYDDFLDEQDDYDMMDDDF